MKKRIVCLLLALVMVLGLCLNGCNNDAKPEETKGQDVPKETQGNAKETEATEKQLEEKTIQVWLLGPGKQKDSDMVWEKFNEMLQAYVPNTTVEFNVISIAEYQTNFEQMLAAGEAIDLAWCGDGWLTPTINKLIEDGNILPLTNWVEEYGQGIKAEYTEDSYKLHFSPDGELYYVPGWQGLAGYKYGIYVPTEFAEMAGATWLEDTQKIVDQWWNEDPSADNFRKVMAQFETYLAAAKDAGKLYGGIHGSKFMGWNYTQPNVAAAEWYGLYRLDDTFTVQDIAASELYKAYCEIRAGWFQKGYMRADLASLDTSAFHFVKNGEYNENTCILYMDQYLVESKLDALAADAGVDLSVIELERACKLERGSGTCSVVPYCADEPERAMMVLNAIYSVPELYQLLIYGIEGMHYTNNGDGTVTTSYGAEGTSDADYGLWRWTIGTCKNSLITQADSASYYTDLANAEPDAYVDPFMDFVFDSSNVQAEMAALAAVRKEYTPQLAGYLGADWEATYNKFLEEREKAGGAKVMAEFEKQIKAYMEEHNITDYSWLK